MEITGLTYLCLGPLNPHSPRRRSHYQPRLLQRPRRKSHICLPSQICHPRRACVSGEVQRPISPNRHPPLKVHSHKVEAGQGQGEHIGEDKQGKGAKVEEEGFGQGESIRGWTLWLLWAGERRIHVVAR